MWTRDMLKTQAKQILRVTYWQSFVVCLLLAAVSGFSGGMGSFSVNFRLPDRGDFTPFYPSHFDISAPRFFLFTWVILLFAVLFAAALGLCVMTFLINPVAVGCRRYFVASALGDNSLNHVGFSFTGGRYKNIVKTMFLQTLYICLWLLLFVIPGIIKAYEYRMVPYIMAENPDMPCRQALELSSRMTYGRKWDIFVLDLSFIGWALLAALTCGIGSLFLAPYIAATDAQLFLATKYDAQSRGFYTGV